MPPSHGIILFTVKKKSFLEKKRVYKSQSLDLYEKVCHYLQKEYKRVHN